MEQREVVLLLPAGPSIGVVMREFLCFAPHGALRIPSLPRERSSSECTLARRKMKFTSWFTERPVCYTVGRRRLMRTCCIVNAPRQSLGDPENVPRVFCFALTHDICFQTNNSLQVYLHVDFTYYPAVRMYETMGYEVVNDLEVSFEVRATLVHVFHCRS